MKNLIVFPFSVLVFAISVQSAVGEGFHLDLSLEEVDEKTKMVRASDLAVNDLATFWVSDFCVKEDRLFLPSLANTKTTTETHAFYLRVKVLPGKQLEATLVEPTKPGEFGKDDLDTLIERLSLPNGIFSNQNMFCEDVDRDWRWPVQFYPVTSIEGHNSLSELVKDVYSRDYRFNDSD